jgi:hypothetical protein
MGEAQRGPGRFWFRPFEMGFQMPRHSVSAQAKFTTKLAPIAPPGVRNGAKLTQFALCTVRAGFTHGIAARRQALQTSRPD